MDCPLSTIHFFSDTSIYFLKNPSVNGKKLGNFRDIPMTQETSIYFVTLHSTACHVRPRLGAAPKVDSKNCGRLMGGVKKDCDPRCAEQEVFCQSHHSHPGWDLPKRWSLVKTMKSLTGTSSRDISKACSSHVARAMDFPVWGWSSPHIRLVSLGNGGSPPLWPSKFWKMIFLNQWILELSSDADTSLLEVWNFVTRKTQVQSIS